jgi:hypothetical protein
MHRLIFLLGAAAWLAGCGQSGESSAAKQATANAAQAKKKKAAYCFFKDKDMKGWAASRDKDGNVVVKGRAFRLDPRYKAVLGQPVVSGASAEIAPTVTINDTGYAARDNWWDLKATIQGSAAVDTVAVRCGEKAVAELKVPLKG